MFTWVKLRHKLIKFLADLFEVSAFMRNLNIDITKELDLILLSILVIKQDMPRVCITYPSSMLCYPSGNSFVEDKIHHKSNDSP